MPRFALIVALCLSVMGGAAPAVAQVSQGEPCAASLVSSVELLLPPLPAGLNPRDLTCNGIVQLHFILTRGDGLNSFQELQRILAVFRQQNLI